jgi:hypothetical protein
MHNSFEADAKVLRLRLKYADAKATSIEAKAQSDMASKP